MRTATTVAAFSLSLLGNTLAAPVRSISTILNTDNTTSTFTQTASTTPLKINKPVNTMSVQYGASHYVPSDYIKTQDNAHKKIGVREEADRPFVYELPPVKHSIPYKAPSEGASPFIASAPLQITRLTTMDAREEVDLSFIFERPPAVEREEADRPLIFEVIPLSSRDCNFTPEDLAWIDARPEIKLVFEQCRTGKLYREQAPEETHVGGCVEGFSIGCKREEVQQSIEEE
ncbi:hypothetical protein N0V90_002787 [Kalmusia sp. IMI 367209]|nr:hypothetical protein N0V90_002787 [Kalmusia sp. IMI 367209]